MSSSYFLYAGPIPECTVDGVLWSSVRAHRPAADVCSYRLVAVRTANENLLLHFSRQELAAKCNGLTLEGLKIHQHRRASRAEPRNGNKPDCAVVHCRTMPALCQGCGRHQSLVKTIHVRHDTLPVHSRVAYDSWFPAKNTWGASSMKKGSVS